ncbi:MAG: nucleotidyltransferase family protein [Clostridia bacterium]|nr:nucleotidyltransferase family protein [Clostridia bacterium]
MITAGIVAEYNPFHNGHKYHIEKTKEETGADTIVAVMSGNFLQRGIPALADKWERAEAACRCGADLVLELPFLYAVNDASVFARGAVGILEKLGCIDFISFGSESEDIGILRNIAHFFAGETPEFREKLQEELKKGLSFPKARAEAAGYCLGKEAREILASPNNILAVEYLKQLEIRKSEIKPFALKRMGGYFDRSLVSGGRAAAAQAAEAKMITEGRDAASSGTKAGATLQDETLKNESVRFASAAAIREKLLETGEPAAIAADVPHECFQVLQRIDSNFKHTLNDFRQLVSGTVFRSTQEEISQIYACEEGLENRITDAVRKSSSVTQLLNNVITKRYTATRIQRLFLQLVVGMKRDTVKNALDSDVIISRVLAANERGRELLRRAKKEELMRFPLVTSCGRNFEKVPLEQLSESERISALELLRLDAAASDIYNLVYGKDLFANSDFVRKPFMLY